MPNVIHWFRQDLRLNDHPSLSAAAQHDVLPIYILDPNDPMGAASRVWLHHSLHALNQTVAGKLAVYHGDPLDVLTRLIERFDVQAVYWQRRYEPWQQAQDTEIKTTLRQAGIEVQSHPGALLWEPWLIRKQDQTPFKVFTPFYRKGCLQSTAPSHPIDAPKLSCITDPSAPGIEALALCPDQPWSTQICRHWHIGEQGAQAQWHRFIEHGIENYKEGRNFPDQPHVSRLSPHLHFGEISPNQLWHDVRSIGDDKNVDHFCSELGWREFSYHLLAQHPELKTTNIQSKFDRFAWETHPEHLRAWQRGQTGIPMVDAGMRELWQTGYMHNRVRMIVGSFLVKNLRLDWRLGEAWFWDCLLDADHANNAASWQWVAGCGADAAPYFRIFNPVTQGQKFDPEGHYIRRYVPEIAALPNRYLFEPWAAPEALRLDAGITLGETYPHPMVDLKASRAEALAAFSALKGRA